MLDYASSPSSNGSFHSKPAPGTNGRHAETPADRSESSGNSFKCEPRNPFVRRVAELRKALLSAVSPDEMRAIFIELVARARAGDVAAAKLVLAYTIGKPQPAPNPDRVDVDEWDYFKATAPMIGEVTSLGLMTPDPLVPLASLRVGREAMTKKCGTLFQRMADEPHTPLKSLIGMMKQRPEGKHAKRDKAGRG